MPFPRLGDALPTRGNRLSRGVGKAVLKIMGWDFEGEVPNVSKAVLIAAPHTSNWDFVVAMATMLGLDLRVTFLGKDTLFRPPFGPLMRWLGGLPVKRTAPEGVVGQVVAAFDRSERLLLGLAPEGTRKRVERWRTGFYHIALGAGVPLIPGYLDYGRKRVGIGPAIPLSGNLEADMQRIRAFYAGVTGKKPDLFA